MYYDIHTEAVNECTFVYTIRNLTNWSFHFASSRIENKIDKVEYLVGIQTKFIQGAGQH
jgi:hypothetical protein